jgi:4-amino-4-deoxy-L-arabinose transferase-like glycosyltransferase
MLESGDFIEPRFQDGPRWQKPIGIYWLQTASVRLLGGEEADIWVYRLPSMLAAIAAVLLTAWAFRPLIGARAAFLAAAMIAGVVVLSFEARTAKTDAALLAAVVAAQGALARLWFGVRASKAERVRNQFYFWTALGVGVLIKGPLIFLPVGGTIAWLFVRERRFSGLKRLGLGWGLVWASLIAAPWFIAIGIKTDGAFFSAALGDDLVGKLAQRREGVSLPPGFHTVVFWGTFWPFTPLALLAVPYVWRWRRAPEMAFMLGWIVPAWIVFELVATKLLHYTLPLYPAIAALAAAAALDGSAKAEGRLFWIAATLWALPAVTLPLMLGVIAPLYLENHVCASTLIGCAIALGVLCIAWRWFKNGLWLAFIRSSLIGAGILYFTAYQFAFPSYAQLWVSKRMVERAAPFQACLQDYGADPVFASVRYHEPSLVFLSDANTQLRHAEAAADWLAREEGALVWVARRKGDTRQRPDEIDRFEARLRANGVEPQPLATTSGFQYNGGRRLVMTLYGRKSDTRLNNCVVAMPG